MSSQPYDYGDYPAWNGFVTASFNGQHDSHLKTGEDYAALPLSAIFCMEPTDKPKMAGRAFIPSNYCDYDAREHAKQREVGEFVALCGDVDKGDHDVETIRAAVVRVCDDSAWLIYSSAHSREGDRRWRIVIPLDRWRAFDEWHDAQCAFFDFMEAQGIKMDRALARAGQPVYLPNVPKVYKDGSALRDADGTPLYYRSISTSLTSPGLDIREGVVATGIAAIREKRAADDKERERLRKEAEQRSTNRIKTDDRASPMEAFNTGNDVTLLLEICGYEQSPRSSQDWRSPQQTGETFATRVMGNKWVSLSESDSASGLGVKCKSGCYGDAYDLYVHYKHRGDHKAAGRAIRDEQRFMDGGNVIRGNFGEPPDYGDDPGWQAMPEWAQGDDVLFPDAGANTEKTTALVNATPFTWRDPSLIPKREWLYGKHLLRKFVSVDVAAGGVGKSSLKIGEAIALASGRDLYDKGLPEGACTVWLWNLEDPHEEMERRIHATANRFKINPDELADRLYVDSGRDQPLIIAADTQDGTKINAPVVEALINEMLARKIDVLIVDPFVSSHAVSENDNNAIDIVAKEWNVIADRTGAAINLVHHVRKGNGVEANADSARGASSLIGKARSVLVYNRMSREDAESLGVDQDERKFHFKVENDKANLAPPEHADWYRMNNVDLPNGDGIGVACPWSPPDVFDGVQLQHLIQAQARIADGKWRADMQAANWAGLPVMQILGLDPQDRSSKKRVSRILKKWTAEGRFEIVIDKDQKRMDKEFLVVGRLAAP